MKRSLTWAVALGAAMALTWPSVGSAQGKQAKGATDHDQVVGHTGAGYFGTMAVPDSSTGGSVTTAIIGVRHWMSSSMGLDLGLGLGFDKTKAKAKGGGASMTTDNTFELGVLLHGGLPITPFYGDHYTFLFVPEANLGFGTTKDKVANPDVKNMGVLAQLGARLGAEVQFGFIGLPNLSLQASVGAYLSYLFGHSKDTATNVKQNSHEVNLSTSVRGQVSDIFNGNIMVIYYF